MEHGVSFDDICRHFEDDHGAKWTASILHLEETPSDPVSCVLKSSLDAPEKLAMLDDICRHFEDDHGAKWTASILHLEETPSDPVSCVLKSSLDAPEKLAMLQILLDGKTWIEVCLLLLKQIAAAIEPILNKYHSLYTYCDTLVSSKDCQKILLRRIGTTLPQDTCILPCLSFCNMADFYISFAAKTQCSNILRLGILFCAIDFPASSLVFPFVTWPIFIFLLLLKHNVPIFSVWVFCSVRLTFFFQKTLHSIRSANISFVTWPIFIFLLLLKHNVPIFSVWVFCSVRLTFFFQKTLHSIRSANI